MNAANIRFILRDDEAFDCIYNDTHFGWLRNVEITHGGEGFAWAFQPKSNTISFGHRVLSVVSEKLKGLNGAEPGERTPEEKAG